MNKRELSLLVAERTGLSKGEASKVVQAMIECMTETLQTGHRIALMGFGSFFLHERSPRIFYDPHSKILKQIGIRKVIKFKPAFPI